MRVSKELKAHTLQNKIGRLKKHLNKKIRGRKIHENNLEAKKHLAYLENLVKKWVEIHNPQP